MAKAFVALRLDGHETVVRAFGMLPHAVQGRAIRPALRAGAAIVRDRAKALAPRDSGRLAGGRWTLRAATRRRNLVGVRVAVPTRGELRIPEKAPGFYPYSQEFGWRAGGPRKVGPLDLGARVLKRDRRGQLYRANQFTAREARQTATAHRRKVQGRRFMGAALFGARAQVIDTVGREMAKRIATLSPSVLAAASREGEAS